MLKKVKRVFPFALVGVLAVSSVALGATADVGSGNYTIASNTNKGSLSEGTKASGVASGINFTGLGTIDVGRDSFIPAATALDYVRVDDNTGKNAGWNAIVSASNLTATVVDSTATGNVTVSIPADRVLTVSASNPTPLFGAHAHAKFLPGPTSLGSGTSAVTFFYADKSQGSGAYTADLAYTLTLPNYLPTGTTVIPTSDQSAFKNVNVPDQNGKTRETELGLFAGTYTTTINYAITQAP